MFQKIKSWFQAKKAPQKTLVLFVWQLSRQVVIFRVEDDGEASQAIVTERARAEARRDFPQIDQSIFDTSPKVLFPGDYYKGYSTFKTGGWNGTGVEIKVTQTVFIL